MTDIFYNVPDSVIKNIEQYFETYLPHYDVVKVMRKSTHPLDSYLFMVIGKKQLDPYKTGEYAYWTCWNNETQSLNYGHYDIETYAKALEGASEYFNY